MGRIEIIRSGEPSLKRDWRSILPGLLISLVALVIVILFVDFDRFLAALKLADYRFLGLGTLLALVWLVIRTMVWRTLLQDKAAYQDVFFTICEGYLINNFVPFRLGEVARALILSRKTSLEILHIFSTIVIERALDMVMAASVLLGSLPFVVGSGRMRSAAFLTFGLVVLVLGTLYGLARYRLAAVGFYEKLSQRWGWLQKMGGKVFASFLSGLGVLTDGRRFFSAIGWVVLNYLFSVIQYFTLLKAFFPQASLFWGFFCLWVSALGIAVPSSPGAVGVFELSLVGALAVFQTDSSAAFAFAVTTHLLGYLTTGILGAYGLARDGNTLIGLYRSALSALLRLRGNQQL